MIKTIFKMTVATLAIGAILPLSSAFAQFDISQHMPSRAEMRQTLAATGMSPAQIDIAMQSIPFPDEAPAAPVLGQGNLQLPQGFEIPAGLEGLLQNMSPEDLQDIVNEAQAQAQSGGFAQEATPPPTSQERGFISALSRRSGLGPDRTDANKFARDCSIVMAMGALDDNQAAAGNPNLAFNVNNENLVASAWWGRVSEGLARQNTPQLNEAQVNARVDEIIADVQNGGVRGETRVFNGFGQSMVNAGGTPLLGDTFLREHAIDCKRLRSELGGN